MIERLTDWLLRVLDAIQIPVSTEEFLEGNEREGDFELPEEDLDIR